MKWRNDGTDDGAGPVSLSHVHRNTEFAFYVWSPRFELMQENLNPDSRAHGTDMTSEVMSSMPRVALD
jgi:hypothetical protein